ncbi:glycosyltransferase family 4 protein [Microbulbifer sp. DLAB2-AF]|uniref:glycosyltransferase family 4 protein n=1 Tax=Microbulbifer sp. DLAB2-AF TaxID=3243395 RepID=UPI004039A85E
MTTISMLVWNEFTNDARVLKEAETLQEVGYKVTVHALHTPGITKQHETLDSGVKVVRTARSPLWRVRKHNLSFNKPAGISKPKSLSPFRQLLKLIARLWTHFFLFCNVCKLKPKIIHAHDVNVLPTAWLAAKFCGAPLVYDAHEISTDREGYSSFRNLVACIEKYVMPRAAGCITTTDERAKFFARAYGVQRPLVLQNRPRFSCVKNENTIRNFLNLEKSWPIVLYQGGLQQGRGLKNFVNAAIAIPNSYFVLIGGGRQASELHEYSVELELEGRVFFIPTQSLDQLPLFTSSADIGVQPIENTCLNHYTTDSNKLFEYIIAGLPVVASRLPEISKIVKENKVGLLSDPGCKESLHRAISQLVNNKSLRDECSRNSREAAKKLSWEEQEKDFINFYRKIYAI